MLYGAIVASVAFLVSAAGLTSFYARCIRAHRVEMDTSLILLAQTAAAMVDAASHAAITRPEDGHTAGYERTVEPLRKLLRSRDDIRSVYTMILETNGPVFVLDATPPGDADGDGVEDHSSPMDRYTANAPALLEALQTGTPRVDRSPVRDSWGSCVSAYAPIRNALGDTIAVVGVDQAVDRRMQALSSMRRLLAGNLAVTALTSSLLGLAIGVLRRRASRYQDLVYRLVWSMPDIVFVKDRNGVYTFCNPRFAELVGRPEGDIIARTDHDLFPSGAADFFRAQDRAVQHENTPRRNEEWITYPDGHRVLVDTLKAPLHSDGGSVIGILGVSRDVTMRWKTEQQIERLQTIKNHLMHLATDFVNVPVAIQAEAIDNTLATLGGLIGADRAYVFLYAFDRRIMCNTHEWCAAGISAEIDNLRELPLDSFPDWVRSHMSGEPVHVSSVAELPPGNLRDTLEPQGIQSLITLPMMHGEQCLGFVGFDAVRELRTWEDEEISLLRVLAELLANLEIRRTTEHRMVETQQTLALSEKRYRGLIDSHRDMIVRVDLEGRLTFVNDAYCAMFGKRREELIGQTFHPLIHEADLPATLDAMKELLAPPYRVSHEQRARTVQGWRWLNWEHDAILDDGRIIEIQAIGRDINDQKRTDEALRATQVLLEQRMQEQVLETRARQTRLNLLFSIVSDVLDSTPRDVMILNAMDRIGRELPDCRIAFGSLDGQGGLNITHSRGTATMPGLAGLTVDLSVAPDYLGALRAGPAVVIPDVSLDSHLAPLAPAVAARATHAILDVPMRHTENLSGLLCADAPAPRAWTAADVALLRECADMLSLALRHDQLRTQEAAAREDLRQEREQLLSIFDGIDQPIYVADPASHEILYANAKIQRSRGDVRHRKCYEALHGFSGPCPFCTNSRLFGPAPTRFVEHSFQNHVTGRWYHCIAQAIEWPDRRHVRLEIAIDYTEQRTSEASRALLATAIETMGDSVLITAADFTVTYVNPAFTLITGYSPDEVVGRITPVLQGVPDDRTLWAGIEQQLATRQEWTGSLSIRRKDGKPCELSTHVRPVKAADGSIAHYVLVGRDTSLRQALERQLAQAQKMESMGRLASGVAHDFNNCMYCVLGFCDMVLEELDAASPVQPHVEQIQLAAQQAADVAQQLLAFSRRQVIQPVATEIDQLIRNQKKMIERVIGEDVAIHLSLRTGGALAVVDPPQIQQVLMNLCINARDAMPDGGPLLVETQVVDGWPPDGSVTPSPRGEFIRIAVVDRGMGMPPEVIERIFEPFFSTKEAGRGTGLGLSVAHGIVKQHGGWITVESQLGHGTRFDVHLPRAGEELKAARAPAAGERPQGRGQTILLVEDSPMVREVASTHLRGLGYHVIQAENIECGWTAYRSAPQPIQALICDVGLPDGSGVTLAKGITAVDAAVRVVMTSGYTDDKSRIQQIQDQRWAFIAKPYSKHRIAELLRDLFASEAP